MKRIVILGAGTGGTIMANRLSKLYRKEIRSGQTKITVIDPAKEHVYQPGLLFVPFGVYQPNEIVKPTRNYLPDDVEYVRVGVESIDADCDVVKLIDGRQFSYDVLVIATGTQLAPEETEGLLGPGWGERVFDFYTLEGASRLHDALEAFEGGRLVVNVIDMPIKCPVAPLEFVFLADWYFTERGIRDRVSITLVTPLDGAFTKPTAARALGHLLAHKGIQLVTEFNTGEVDGVSGKLVSYDDREIPFDLLVTVPLHVGAPFVGNSDGLGDDFDFVLTDPHTLQATRKQNIFVLGDATNVPTSKAGSVAHFQAEVLTDNIERFVDGDPLEPAFDGHANCFVETGFDRALLIDFNYEVEPLPGKFPFANLGPMALLKETKLNHLGKLFFRWLYWNVLLPGHPMPGITTQLNMKGKNITQPTGTGV